MYPIRILIAFTFLAYFEYIMPARAADDVGTRKARLVSFHGYDDCIQIENDTTKVVLCPAAGGRVLVYAMNGTNALYLPPGEEGWTLKSGRPGGEMQAGRFDIGPEQTIPKHPQLWKGPWKGEITGIRSARMTSVHDKPTGAQLIRDFELDERTTRLECTQTIRNVSQDVKEYCHWSRTFAQGNGICLIPLTRPSRLPNGYVMYGPGPAINFRPQDPNIRQRAGFLEILAAPRFPKLGMDSYAGWFAYQMPSDLLFVKKFPTYPDRVYNEVAGLTISIWYPDRPMCELEPIGPRERLLPGDSSSFTETWWLLTHPFPTKSNTIDLKKLTEFVAESTR